MDKEILERANSLEKEIKQLEQFINYAQMTWKSLSLITRMKLALRIPKFKNTVDKHFMVRHEGYGAVISHEYRLSKELSEKIFNVLEEHLDQLKKEFAELK